MYKNLVVIIAVVFLSIAISGCDDDPTSVTEQRYSVGENYSFEAGDYSISSLVVENFVGNATVRPGAADVIIISATKWAKHEGDLAKISLDIFQNSGGVFVDSDNPSEVHGVSVDFDITVPPDTWVSVKNGVGSISYRGRAGGGCHFDTGVGSIRLNLPSDINVEVELSVGVGSIHIDFPVNGQISRHSVKGIIGNGTEGEILAVVGVGNLFVQKQ
jgi:hypothetical protein